VCYVLYIYISCDQWKISKCVLVLCVITLSDLSHFEYGIKANKDRDLGFVWSDQLNNVCMVRSSEIYFWEWFLERSLIGWTLNLSIERIQCNGANLFLLKVTYLLKSCHPNIKGIKICMGFMIQGFDHWKSHRSSLWHIFFWVSSSWFAPHEGF